MLRNAILGYTVTSRNLENIHENVTPWSSITPREVFSKGSVDVTFGNVSFLILKDCTWLQLVYFLTMIAFGFVKCLFPIDTLDELPQGGKVFTVLCLSLKSAIMGISRHYIN